MHLSRKTVGALPFAFDAYFVKFSNNFQLHFSIRAHCHPGSLFRYFWSPTDRCNKTNRCRPWLRFPVHSNQRPAPCSSKQSRLVECCECVTGDGISVESMLSCSAHIHQCHRYNIKLGNVQSTRWHNSFRTLTRLNDHFSTATCWASCRELSSLSLFLVIECCAAPCLFHSFILWLLLSIRPWGTKCIT